MWKNWTFVLFESNSPHDLLIDSPSQSRHESSSQHSWRQTDEKSSETSRFEDRFGRLRHCSVDIGSQLHLGLEDICRMSDYTREKSCTQAAGEVAQRLDLGRGRWRNKVREGVVFQLGVEHQIQTCNMDCNYNYNCSTINSGFIAKCVLTWNLYSIVINYLRMVHL